MRLLQSGFKKAACGAAAVAVCALALTGCGNDQKEAAASGITVVKVGVVGDYNAQWDTVNKLLEKDKIQVKLVKFSDYATPNRALADGEIDLNAFQHKAFLANDIARNGYKIEAIGDTLITPLRVFNNKEKLKSMKDVKDGDIFAIPSDLTNGGRALLLLQEQGLITLKEDVGLEPTKLDIAENPHNYEIVEMEAAQLPRSLGSLDIAVINGNYAIQAGFDPTKDTLATEKADGLAAKTYQNILVVKEGNENTAKTKELKKALKSDEVRDYINKNYKGAVVPVF